MAKQFGLGKKERLKSRKQIDSLFAGGKSFAAFPLRVVYRFESPAETPGIRVGVTAPKKHFKKAVDRNRIKRLLREAYRLQKTGLTEAALHGGKAANVFFMYTDKSLPLFETVQPAMARCILHLQQKLKSHEALA